MAARDDSVIRGSLITSLIFLVLSLALNFILWSMASKQSEEREKVATRLQDVSNGLRDVEERNIDFMKMVGAEPMTQADYDAYGKTATEDEAFNSVAQKFYDDMKVFGLNVGIQDKHYGKLTEYFTTSIRDRNEQYRQAREDAAQVKAQADKDVATARTAQAKAETERDNLLKQLEDERAKFAEYRNDLVTKMEQARDSKTRTEQELQKFQRQAGTAQQQLAQKAQQLQSTIETQKQELNKLRGGRFESVQGEIRYVLRGGRIVSINLGSADALRPGITFGVVDRDETARLQDADVKASIQVTKILGPHLAEARVVAMPEIGNPIIEGDAVHSPFWAPGRTVRIALAGPIDIDGDERPDNDALEGMIIAAGAEIADNGQGSGRMDPGIRFLVVGEQPDVGGQAQDSKVAALLEQLGDAKQRAIEAGVTVIPAWKLQAYLKTIDDSLTTPLGSAVRGDDFPPTVDGGRVRRRPVDLPDLYKNQKERVQETNEIVRP